jgi:hypothetical protein
MPFLVLFKSNLILAIYRVDAMLKRGQRFQDPQAKRSKDPRAHNFHTYFGSDAGFQRPSPPPPKQDQHHNGVFGR